MKHQSTQQADTPHVHELPLVIVADASENVRMKIKYLLEAEKMHVHLADSGSRVKDLVREEKPDLILLDVTLPDIDATEFVREIKEYDETRSVLVMLISPSTTTLRNIQGLSAGADDFMAKPFFDGLLLAKVKAMLRLKGLQDELEEANRKLEKLAITDPLTQLYNYRYLYQRLGEELSEAARYDTELSVISFDIDFFKSVNDTLGHQFGDLVLINFAELLKKPSRESDIVARNGGEEFMVVLPRTPVDNALTMANRTLDLIREHSFRDKRDCISLTASAGITGIAPGEGITCDELIRRVDIALYKAKRSGRNQACLWTLGEKLLPEDPKEKPSAPPLAPTPVCEPKAAPPKKELDRQVDATRAESISALAAALEAKDLVSVKRAQKAADLTRQVAQALDLGEATADAMHKAALLHDVGQIGIKDAILKKEGPLTDAEQMMLQKHPEYSVNILKSVKELADQLPMVRHHHERYDGKGYPDKLSGDAIPIGARIMAIADAYVSLTLPTRYKKAMSRGLAIEELKKHAGTQFDPRIVETVISLVDGRDKT